MMNAYFPRVPDVLHDSQAFLNQTGLTLLCCSQSSICGSVLFSECRLGSNMYQPKDARDRPVLLFASLPKQVHNPQKVTHAIKPTDPLQIIMLARSTFLPTLIITTESPNPRTSAELGNLITSTSSLPTYYNPTGGQTDPKSPATVHSAAASSAKKASNRPMTVTPSSS